MASLRLPPDGAFEYLGFNQDGTLAIACPNKSGIVIQSLSSTEKALRLDVGHISFCAILYSTSLLAYCAANAPRQLVLYNTSTKEVIRRLNFASPLHNIEMSKRILCVSLETWVLVYNVESLALECSIECKSNPRGLLSLAQTAPLIAFPASPTEGSMTIITVADPNTEDNKKTIRAHRAPLASLAWSTDEDPLLATASLKGTTIRVWKRGEKVFTLRRGQSPARITSLAFVPHRKPPVLIAGCDHATIHIWALEQIKPKDSFSAVARHVVSALAPIRTPNSRRGEKLATIKLLCRPGPLIIASRTDQKAENGTSSIAINVLTSEGVLYSYLLQESHNKLLNPTLLLQRRIA